jgi:hypothetical protein
MHVYMLSQLVADRKDELTASAERHRARQPLERRALRAAAADESLAVREWRALLRVLQLAR